MCLLDPKLIALAVAIVLSALEVKGNECPDGSVVYTPPGATYTCAKCQKGQRVVEDCKEGELQSTRCEDCPPNQYQNCLSGSRQCYDCKTSCEKNQVVDQQCTKTEALQCKCKVDHAATMQGVELLCQPCARLKVVTKIAGGEECQPCPEHQYYFKNASLPDVPAKCLPCTECTQVESPCGEDHDAKCQEIINEPSDNMPLAIGLGVCLGISALIALVIVIVCCYRRRKGPPDGSSILDVRDCSDLPEINDDDFLIGKTFAWLAKNLGTEWTVFMRDLPGNEFQRQVHVVLDHSHMNERVTTERIIAALERWKNECPEDVTTSNIVETLYKAKKERFKGSRSRVQMRNRFIMDYKRALQEWTKSSNGGTGALNGSSRPSPDVVGSGASPSNPGPEAGDPRGGGDHPDMSPPGPASHGPPPSGLPPSAPPPPGPPPSGTRSSSGPARLGGGPSMFGGGEDVPDGRRRNNPTDPNPVNPPQLELAPPPPLAMAESFSDPSPLSEGTRLLDSSV